MQAILRHFNGTKIDLKVCAFLYKKETMADDDVDYSEYTLYAKTVQGGALRALFECLSHIIHDSNITWEPDDGMKILTMDGSRCALIHLILEKDKFDEYYCQSKTVMGLNMNSMWKLLKTAGTHDTITLYTKQNQPHELGIVINNSDKNATTEYKLSLLDCDAENIQIPDVTFDRVLTLPSGYFQRMAREMSNLGEFITISVKGAQLQFTCKGSFATQHTNIGESNGCMSVSSSTGEDVEGIYSLRYLSLFTRASGLCNTVVLYLKQNFPLLLSYNVASLGTLRFCLATRVEE
jgi:proliferating cell nuclear antigen